jgi:hypothetical protein
MTEAQGPLPLGGTNPPQFAALDELGPQVGLVTVGISGNDIGFGGATQECVQPPRQLGGTSCKERYTADGTDDISEKIAIAAPRVAAVIQGIKTRAPNALVLVVGYPALMPEYRNGCYPYVPVLPEDAAWVREKNKELNAMLAQQAAANGATYVDWYTPSIGHDMCTLPHKAWVNGLVVVPPSYPAHPNVFGEAGAAAAVRRALPAGFSLLD